MALPPSAEPLKQPFDPADLDVVVFVISQGRADSDPAPVLMLGEAVAAYQLKLTPEAITAGLIIDESDAYKPVLNGNRLTLYVRLDEDMADLPRFDSPGVVVGIEVLIWTTAVPPRRKQRTHTIRIKNL